MSKENINIQNTNQINYAGNVTIKVCDGKKVIRTIKQHNAGTELFFKILCLAVCGNQDMRSSMPRYLDLGMTQQEGSYESFLTSRKSLTSLHIETVAEAESINHISKFTALITPNDVLSDCSNINTLTIYNQASGRPDEGKLATVTLNPKLNLSTTSTYNYIIEWAMTFGNVEVTGNTDISPDEQEGDS